MSFSFPMIAFVNTIHYLFLNMCLCKMYQEQIVTNSFFDYELLGQLFFNMFTHPKTLLNEMGVPRYKMEIKRLSYQYPAIMLIQAPHGFLLTSDRCGLWVSKTIHLVFHQSSKKANMVLMSLSVSCLDGTGLLSTIWH